MNELISRMRLLGADHAPDGWPAVQTRDITALLERITELEQALKNIASQPETGWMGAMECQSIAREALKEVE